MDRPRRLAIVLSTGPERGEFAPAAALAHAARSVGIDVEIFFMHQGVDCAARAPDAMRRLAQDGCELIACASSADQLGLHDLPADLFLGSQDDHAAMVGRADRVVAFT